MLKYSEQNFNKFVEDNYPGDETFLTHVGRREEFNRKNSQIVVNEIPVDVVFIGDSITEAFEVSVLFKKYGTIINRGYSGEMVADLKKRFKADCIDLKPKVAILCSGINDMYPLYQVFAEGREVTEELKVNFLQDIEKIYLDIVKQAKNAGLNLWIASVLPLGTSDFRSQLIVRVNNIIKKICQENNLTYVDYHSAMTEDDNLTLKNFTFGDDLHPHVKGYNVMYKVVDDLLKDFNF